MANLDGVLGELQGMAAAADAAGGQAGAAGSVIEAAIGQASALGLDAIAERLSGIQATIGRLQGQIGAIGTSIREAMEPVAQAPKEVTPAEAVTVLGAAIQLVDTAGGAIRAAHALADAARGEGAAALQGGDEGPLVAALSGVGEQLDQASERRAAAEEMINEIIGRTGGIGGRGN
jgi:hypothetical protein